MAWLQKLHETYQHCVKSSDLTSARPWPLSHFVKQAHIEVVIDAKGNFRKGRVRKLEWNESPTLIPATESSAGRTSDVAPHPLCEEVGYCAFDFPEIDLKKFEEYKTLLTDWCTSDFAHPKAQAVLAYLKKGCLWTDLSAAQIFPVTITNRRGQKTKLEDEKVFIRWRIETIGDPCSGTWEDQSLIKSWIGFDGSKNRQVGFCIATAQQVRIAQNHSRFIRHPGDGAKLISANDFSGYTFRGRFTDSKKDYEKQVCSVGFEVSQKAHNALRWLISRQSYRNDDQVIVTWAVTGKPVPDPFANTYELFGTAPSVVDTSQAFAMRLNAAMAGYGSKLDPTDDVVVMGLDAATPGRMAITYYRELKGSEFLDRIETWHSKCAWPQNFGKESKFIGAPAPRDIAEAAYGRRLDDNLRKATVERLLPCIIDAQPIPHDLVASTSRRASNRASLEKWEWEKYLGIACALFRAYHTERSYQMALESNRITRDYLYGRLLAVAEHIEGRALYVAGETRDTTAARLMQRFSDRPHSTWRNIELALTPYKTRLRAKRAGFLRKMEQLLDKITCSFNGSDYVADTPLSGEFLLGYHCQRQALWSEPDTEDESTPTND